MVKNHVNIDIIIEYILMFLMFTYWPSQVLGTTVCRTMILILLAVFWLKNRKIQLRFNVLTVFFLLVFFHCLAMIFGSVYMSLDIGNISALLSCLIFVGLITSKEFFEKYYKMMVFLCGYSIVTYFLYLIVPSLFLKLPKVHGTGITANAFFSLVPINLDTYYRNFGCWGEPGMFSVYLIIALIIGLFYVDINIKHIAILVVAMVTTFSTSGYIAMVLILGAFLLNILYKKKDKISSKLRVQVALFTILGVGIFVYLYCNGYFGGRTYVFEKLKEFGESSGTSFERLRAVKLSLEMIKDYFPIGSGWGVYTDILLRVGILTATPLNWFAIYGMCYGIIMNIGVFIFANRMGDNWICKIAILLAMLATILSQEMSSTFIYILLIFYAYGEHNFRHESIEQVVFDL